MIENYHIFALLNLFYESKVSNPFPLRFNIQKKITYEKENNNFRTPV